MILPVIRTRIVQIAILCVLVGGSLLFIRHVGERGGMSIVSTATWVAAVAWVALAADKWWIITPVSVAFGGTLLVGHKYYPHEMALVLSVLALFPAIALRRKNILARPPLPWATYVLVSLFMINWVVSCYGLNTADVGDLGSLSRAYMNGLWVLIFGILFYKYGILNPALILHLLYGTFLLRAILGGLSVVFQDIFPIPSAGFFLSGMALGLGDYRVTGLQLGLLAYVHAGMSQRRAVKFMHYVVVVIAVALTAMGGGRVMVAMICLIPLILSVLRRRFGWFALMGAVVVAFIIILNRYPDSLYRLPESARRSLSILVSESSTRWLDWHDMNRISNMWHQRLGQLGFERWTETPLTFLFGNRVEPFDEAYNAYSATWETKADIAAKLGLYEAGLWTVLGLAGIIGFLAYLRMFLFLLKGPLRLIHSAAGSHPARALAFIALVSITLWAVFSWIAGGFPSYELLLAFLAKAAYEDSNRRETEGTLCAS